MLIVGIMRNMNKFVVMFIVPFMAACGIQRHAKQSARQVAQPQRVEAFRCEPSSPCYTMLSEETPSPTAVQASEIHFQPLEYQHVRIRGINNPLPIDQINTRYCTGSE